MTKKKRLTKHDLILEVWNKSGSESAGAYELGLIQQALEQQFGRGAVASPASLARRLADNGIPLRHPEVLEADSSWRESRFHELFGPGELTFGSLDSAVESVGKLEDLRSEFVVEGDKTGLKSLVEHAREIKRDLVGQDSEISKEVAEWLTVWLQNPEIFKEWLSLRRGSAGFLKRFGDNVR